MPWRRRRLWDQLNGFPVAGPSSKPGADIVEQWMKPAGGTMLGMSRTVVDGKTKEFEFLQIRASDTGEIQFIARPSGQPEATFRLTGGSDKEAIFANPEHDFPQKVIYRLAEDGSLAAGSRARSAASRRASISR
jgi:hypothetical protein